MAYPFENNAENQQIMLDNALRVSSRSLQLRSAQVTTLHADNTDQTSEVFGNLGGLQYSKSPVFRILPFKGRIEEGMGFVIQRRFSGSIPVERRFTVLRLSSNN